MISQQKIVKRLQIFWTDASKRRDLISFLAQLFLSHIKTLSLTFSNSFQALLKREERGMREREWERKRCVLASSRTPTIFFFLIQIRTFPIRNRDDNFRKFCRSSSESVIILEIIIFRKFEKNHFQSFFDEMFRIFGRFCSGIFLADWKKKFHHEKFIWKKSSWKQLIRDFPFFEPIQN